MNVNREEPAGKSPLKDTLLDLDRRTAISSAEGREVAKRVLRRDRRQIRILTWLTIGFFLLTVIGICGSVYWYYVKVVPEMNGLRRAISELEPQLSKQDPPATTTLAAAWQCHVLYRIQLANLWGISALLAVMLAAAVCTVLLIMATRGATLRQIQASLSALSEQFDAMQQSLQASHPSGTGRTPQESSG